MAADIERHLNDEPVLACPPSMVYRLRKFARRNKTVLGTVVLVTAVLLISTAVSIWQAVEANDARQLAEAREQRAVTEAAKANAVTNLLQEMLGSANPDENRGMDYTVRELLDHFSAGLGDQFADQPEAEAMIRRTIGNAFRRLGMPGKAEPHLKAALETRRRIFGDEHELVAESLLDYSWLQHEKLDMPAAETYAREALAISRKLGNHAEPILKALRVLQLSLTHGGKQAQADSVAREAIEIAGNLPSKELPDLASIMHMFANSQIAQGNYERGEELARKAVAMHRKLNADWHIETAWALYVLGGRSSVREIMSMR